MPLTAQELALELCRLPEFDEVVGPKRLRDFLATKSYELEFKYADCSQKPLIQSGQEFQNLILIRQGTVLTWTNPPSFLPQPFLIGQHELLPAGTEIPHGVTKR